MVSAEAARMTENVLRAAASGTEDASSTMSGAAVAATRCTAVWGCATGCSTWGCWTAASATAGSPSSAGGAWGCSGAPSVEDDSGSAGSSTGSGSGSAGGVASGAASAWTSAVASGTASTVTAAGSGASSSANALVARGSPPPSARIPDSSSTNAFSRAARLLVPMTHLLSTAVGPGR